MASLLPFSVCRRIVMDGILWPHVKPQLLSGRLLMQHRRWFTSVKASAPQTRVGPEGQTAPEKFDGGDYEEEKNEEYEKEAEQRAQRYRRIKKIASTALFVSVLGYVGYSRRVKKKEVADYYQNTKFLPVDPLFTGSEKLFCYYEVPHSRAKVVLPASIIKDGTMAKIADFKLDENDIIVASFPKAGTTWMQEIVYLINNNLNFKEASRSTLETRFPFLEYVYPGLQTIAKMPAPRMIKTHLPFDFLPKSADRAKIIYIARNPKDTVVSYYHFARMFTMSSFEGSFEEFLERFQKGELPYCPFFDHVESYVAHKDDPNVLIVTYEDLSNDPAEVIQKVASFLGKTLSHEEIKLLVDHTRFDKMSKNASANYQHWDEIGFRKMTEAKFMRKGEVGDWRNYLDRDSNKRFDEWAKTENKTGFPFMYEK